MDIPSGLKCIIVLESMLGGNHEGLLAQLRAHGLRVITCTEKIIAEMREITSEAGLREALKLNADIALKETLLLVDDHTCERVSEIARAFQIQIRSIWPVDDLARACWTFLHGPRTFSPIVAA